ncbi:protein ACCELERATED CELL DEATH 6-like [Prunus dulcis]|uniref:protein ACCELERATED CELL DEATH 6-like n=1 Tax=Prunus dulcis TaxID=3755 RepID=UPI001481E48F|nr:protein ACCELERATED CELL DEATH 6-like [Prunus dulcis]
MDHSADQTENAVDQEAATDNTVLTRGMDLDVFDAAKEGKTDVLKRRHHLHQILTPTKNTVLHIYIAFASTPNYVEPEHEALRPPSIVKEILQMWPALLSQKNESGETALHIAARHGRADIVELLIKTAKAGRPQDLENGPTSSIAAWQMLIRETNNEKDTALHFAVRFNHFRVVEILTREDPDFSYSANDAGETPLYLAAERKYGVLFSEILSTCTDPNYQGLNGRTALHAALIYGDKKMTEEILEKKKDLAIAADEQGWTPLHYAAFSGCTSIVKQLLQADRSSAYIVDKADKKTALHIAASRGHIGVVKDLISHCPDCCELVDQRRRNALHYALEKHQSRITTFVLKDSWLSNILLNAKDVDGNTPLHLLDVSLFGTRFIGDARVDKMTFNKENMNALDVIIADDSRNEIYLEQALKKNGAESGHRILSKSYGGHRKLKENKGGEDTDETNNVSEAHLVVAALIATVTFAAGFTIPGGYQSEKGPEQGSAVLSKNVAFKAFVITNTLALCMSSFSVLMHLYVSMHTKRKGISAAFDEVLYTTMWALILMVVAFLTGTYAILSPGLAITACVIGCFFFLILTHATLAEISPTYQRLIVVSSRFQIYRR